MHRSGKRTLAIGAIVGIVFGVIALNTVLALGWRAPRLDFTQERLYTLSPGVKQLVKNLDEKVYLDLYWSDSVGADLPQYRMLAQQTREFLDELASASGGNIVVKQVDPKPFSEEEDAARAAGLAVQPIDGAGRTLTLGLVVRGPTDKQEVIPFLRPEEEPFLEYELARRIVSVERANKPVVAVLSTLPENRGGDPRDPASGGPSVMLQQLRTLFDVRYVPVMPDGAVTLPPDAKVLALIQPRGWSEPTLKAIDEWVSSGKPTLAFLDPWCETDPAARQQGFNQGNSGTTFDIGPLLGAWGLEVPMEATPGASTSLVVGDKTYATRVRTRVNNQLIELDYVPYLSLRDKAIAANDPITGTLKQINMMTAGSLLKAKDATTTIEPILSSSTDCELISTLKLGFFGQPDQLLKDFKSIGTAQFLGVRVNGPIKSGYAAPPAEGAALPAPAPANLIVFSDADMLEDGAWVRENRFGNQVLGFTAFADNSELVINAIETLTGERALSELRGRGQYRRPFERVEALRKAADASFLAEQTALEAKKTEVEQKINQLQREKGAGQNALVLTPEQEAELKKLQAARLEAQKSLRGVQHRLVADVEKLGNSLMLINVVLWPIFVALVTSFWMIGRARQQRGGSPSAKGAVR